jgi:hypothetical protein
MKTFFCIYALCYSSLIIASCEFPSHWWKKHSNIDAPSWEVLPHSAKKNKEVILSKRNELGKYLSNIALTPFKLKGEEFASVEGLWQSLKYPDPRLVNDVRNNIIYETTRENVRLLSWFDAINAGRKANRIMKEININWVSFQGNKMRLKTIFKGAHYHLIKSAIKQKLIQNPQALKLLLSTCHLKLRPDHKIDWFMPPAWKYHKILMELRSEFLFDQSVSL